MPIRPLGVLLGCALMLAAAPLQELVQKTLERNHKLHSFALQAKAAQYRLKQARDALLPSLSLSASAGKDAYYYQYPTRKITYDSTTTLYSISLRQPLYQAQIFARIHQEKLKRHYTQLQQAAYRNDLLKEVIALYIDGVYYASVLELAKRKLHNWQKIYQQVQKRHKLRFATKSDLAMAQANLAAARNDLAQARYNLQNVERQLRIYAGVPLAITHRFTRSIVPEPIAPSIRSNPSLRLAKLNCKIAKSEIDTRKAALYPSLALTASYSDTDSSDSITRRGNKRIFIELQMSLFDKRNYDATSEAYVLYKAAKEDLADLEDRLSLRLSNLHYNIESLQELIKKDDALIQARRTYAKQAQLSFANALISLADLAAALNDLDEAQSIKLSHQRQLLQSYVELRNLTGALLEDEGASLVKYFRPKE